MFYCKILHSLLYVIREYSNTENIYLFSHINDIDKRMRKMTNFFEKLINIRIFIRVFTNIRRQKTTMDYFLRN